MNSLHKTVYASLLAALTAVGAYMIVPFGPVPLSLQTMVVYLTGLLLGSRWGLASISVYILAGVLGLPVFAKGGSGIGHIWGPTGGYLIGFLPAVAVIGLISEAGKQKILYDVTAVIIGTMIIYICGVSWLKIVTSMSWTKAMAAGMLPFLIGDTIKMAAAVLIAKSLRPVLMQRRSW